VPPVAVLAGAGGDMDSASSNLLSLEVFSTMSSLPFFKTAIAEEHARDIATA